MNDIKFSASNWVAVIAITVSMLLFLYGVKTNADTEVSKQVKENTINIAVLQTDIRHIKKGIDDIKTGQLTVEKLVRVLKLHKID